MGNGCSIRELPKFARFLTGYSLSFRFSAVVLARFADGCQFRLNSAARQNFRYSEVFSSDTTFGVSYLIEDGISRYKLRRSTEIGAGERLCRRAGPSCVCCALLLVFLSSARR